MNPIAPVERLESRELMTAVIDSIGFPRISFDANGSLAYDATSHVLAVEARPIGFRMSDGAPAGIFDGARSITLSAEVDEFGELVGGVSGPDLRIVGNLSVDQNFSFEFTGTLLTAEVVAFGAEETGSTDIFTYIFEVTGGTAASLYPTGTFGVIVQNENSTFDDSFLVDFDGKPKGELGAIAGEAIPEPSTVTLALSGSAALLLMRRRQHRR